MKYINFDKNKLEVYVSDLPHFQVDKEGKRLEALLRKEINPNWIKNSVYWFIDYQGDAWFLCLELSPKMGHYTYDTSVEFDFEYKGEIGTGEVGIHRYEVR